MGRARRFNKARPSRKREGMGEGKAKQVHRICSTWNNYTLWITLCMNWERLVEIAKYIVHHASSCHMATL